VRGCQGLNAAEQPARYLLADEGVALVRSQPPEGRAVWSALDPQYVGNSLGDGMQVADDSHELVTACLGLQHGQGRSGEVSDEGERPARQRQLALAGKLGALGGLGCRHRRLLACRGIPAGSRYHEAAQLLGAAAAIWDTEVPQIFRTGIQ